ncbi:MAG: hypothetical protein HFJ53_05010 [Clostridia bacterium]|jgi:hypothetical protein|nr:hypothetical protein [Clostridia bacterium]
MRITDDLFLKMNTLPWQALFDYAKSKEIKEEEIKNKDKKEIIFILDNKNLIHIDEINKLVEDYIYGNRVTFSLWRFNEKLEDENILNIKKLEGKNVECNLPEYRKVHIQRVNEYEDRLEILYVYSKVYSYTNENGKLDQVWEQHRGCSWIGKSKSYVANIVKHEKMTQIFINTIASNITKSITQMKPPISALNRIFTDSVMSKIVLQGENGEKTAISRSDGFTDEQQEEVKRIKNKRFNTSGSYITKIIEDKTATIRYNVVKGNISILKHLSSKILFDWTKLAIDIIFEEIDKLKGQDAKVIFEEMGLKLKWSLLSLKEQEKMNWFLTQIIVNINNCEQQTMVPDNVKAILNKEDLFIKVVRPYCEQCDSYEIVKCSECGKVINTKDILIKSCECGAILNPVCGEGHRVTLDKYWYIPTEKFKQMINVNLKQILNNDELNYEICIMDDMMFFRTNIDENSGEEIFFYEIDCFKNDKTAITEKNKEFAISMKEKCGRDCSVEKIEKCKVDKDMICLPKVFYNILPGFIPQPHKGGEYGDISAQIISKNKKYEMKGIIKKNSSKSANKKNIRLLSTSKEGSEIIRQFVEQGMCDQRCEMIFIVIPQNIDNSLKGTLRFLARLSNKKIVFIELEELCMILKQGKIVE